MHLLDINVLIARVDAQHIHHTAATRWLTDHGPAGWATCPITENGLLRIMGHPSYPGGPGHPEPVVSLLRGLFRHPGHQFWPDDFSLLTALTTFRSVASSQLTDLYLLALAARHGGRFLTFDRKVDPALVPGGPASFDMIGGSTN